MSPDEKQYRFSYKPGRTVEELEHERLSESLQRSPTQRFKIMMALIRISQKARQATAKQKLNGYL
jgi:hypothetical protein